MGSYDELEGGLFENSALYLSGGLHEQFHTNIARKLSSLTPDSILLFDLNLYFECSLLRSFDHFLIIKINSKVENSKMLNSFF